MNSILKVENLSVEFKTERGSAFAVRNVNFYIGANETLALVGESGSGKSVTAKSILRLHDQERTTITGNVQYRDKNLLEQTKKQIHEIRGNHISMIFQDPMISLNPLIKVGEQISETMRYHKGINRIEAQKATISLLNDVRISSPKQRYHQYPHEFSGGMLQRIMIAIALSCRPEVLIADEPTTALDVTIQAQILNLMQELQKKYGMAILLITHNLGVVAEMCDRVAVMYGGEIVEMSYVDSIFKNPLHPYTVGLLNAIPKMGQKGCKLKSIEGSPPGLFDRIAGCSFAPRCDLCMDRCYLEKPELKIYAENSMVACHYRI